jgi:hypothetical protein
VQQIGANVGAAAFDGVVAAVVAAVVARLYCCKRQVAKQLCQCRG